MGADFSQFGSGYVDHGAVNFDMVMGNGINPATAYDANGNIVSMKQWGLKLGGSELIDDLNYHYEINQSINTNKLKNVIDASNDIQTVLGDFRSSQLYMTSLNNNKTVAATDYTYDANGNLKKDLNKDIGTGTTEGIEYNHMNLPWKITARNTSGVKGVITYIYDAAGNKLEKRVHDNTNTTNPDRITTYIGGVIYENNHMQFLSMEEGRIRIQTEMVVTGMHTCDPYPGAPPDYCDGDRNIYGPQRTLFYDYFIKDHLGNVRMVLTDEVQKDIYPIASLENANAVNLEDDFYNINQSLIVPKASALAIPDYVNKNLVVEVKNPHVDETANSGSLYRLNGNNDNTKMGLGITLKVMAGDEVHILGKSYWKTAGTGIPAGGPGPVSVLNLLKDFVGSALPGGGKAGVTGEQLNALSDIVGGIGSLLGGQQETSTKPKAYINWILFDENLRPVVSSLHNNSFFDQVDAEGVLKSHFVSTGELTKSGYLYIYCSNETKLDVFFDNLQVVHTRGPLLEETHYYPFGLTMAGISSKAMSFGGVENNIKFQGQELNEDFDIDWYEFKWRNHDPQIGRFIQIDPLAEEYEYNSTYAFSENKVTGHIELEGLEAVPVNGGGGNPLAWIFKPVGDAMIAAGNWFDKTFSFGAKEKVETPIASKGGNSQLVVVETTIETQTNIGGVLSTLKNSERPMTYDELPSLTNTTVTTTVSAQQKLEIKTPIGKSTTNALVDNNGKTTVEQKVEINKGRGVVGAGVSRSSDGTKKIEASLGTDNTKGKASVSVLQNGKSTTVEAGVGAEQKVGNTKVSVTGFVKVKNNQQP